MEDNSIGNQPPEGAAETQRRDERDSLLVLAHIRLEGDSREGVTVRVRNVSSGGLMAEATEDYRAGMRVEVDLDGIGRQSGSIAWAEAGRIGIAFDHPVDKARARKPQSSGVKKGDDLFRPSGDYRRPGLKPKP